jgi:hypothetical protein
MNPHARSPAGMPEPGATQVRRHAWKGRRCSNNGASDSGADELADSARNAGGSSRGGQAGGMPLEQALRERRSVHSYGTEPLTLTEIAQLLWAAQESSEPREGFRTAP